MSGSSSRAEFVGRRGELLAELFLQDLGPELLARATPNLGYDFLVGFPNERGGINNFLVEVKSTEKLSPDRFPLSRRWYERFRNSNTPCLLVVVNVKENRFYCALISRDSDPVDTSVRDADRVMVRLIEVDYAAKEELRKQLSTWQSR
jgi:hypothetical protein